MGTLTTKLKNDISAVECTVNDCKISFEHSEGEGAEVRYTRGVSVYTDKAEGKLIIRQKRGLLTRIIFGNESEVKIAVPGHIVPRVLIRGTRAECYIEGGIYGEVEFAAAGGSLKAEGAAMESCTINSADCNTHLADCTVKGNVVTNTEKGDVSLEHTFATHTACRTKSGNIGAVELNCKDTIFEVGEGNVTATVLGDESTFDVIVNAKEGTCNKESLNIENNECSFKAYVQKGNIFVDFVDDKEN